MTPHDRFTAARQAMIVALDAWLSTRPDPDDVEMEIEGTGRAIRGVQAVRATAKDKMEIAE